jgi:hypothetical protein
MTPSPQTPRPRTRPLSVDAAAEPGIPVPGTPPAAILRPPAAGGTPTPAAAFPVALGAAAGPVPAGGTTTSLPAGQCSPRRTEGRPDPGTGREDPAADLRMPSRPGRGRTRAPAPVTRAAHLDRAPATGRVPGKTPAGGAPASTQADSVPPAGSTGRTWTLELPAGMELLSLNGREHWAARHRKTQALKDAAIVLTRKAKIPPLERVSVVAEYQPPDRRHRDPDNIALSAKAAIDGCRIAGLVPQDDSRHVLEVTCRIGEFYPKGRLVLTITEIAATGSDAA